MEVHTYSVTARLKQVKYDSKIKWQHKKAKAERKSARNCKNFHVLPENLAEGLGSGRGTAGVMYQYMRIHPEI